MWISQSIPFLEPSVGHSVSLDTIRLENHQSMTPTHSPRDYSPLVIKRVDAFCTRLPLTKPVLMAGIEIRSAENIFIRIETNNHLVGWGEATSAPTHGGATIEQMSSVFERLIKPFLIGEDALKLSALSSQLMQSPDAEVSTVAAVDEALHDLVGKHLGVPAHVLLGGMRRSSVTPLWLIGTSSAEHDLEATELKYKEGYRFFKLKLGVKSLAEDIKSTLAIKAKYGAKVRLCGDVNMGWSVAQAREYAQATHQAGVDFLEQPLHKDDHQGLKELIANTDLPICLDEAITSTDDIVYAANERTKGVSLKTLKFAGMGGVCAAGHLCSGLGLNINLSGKVAESGVGAAALLQISAALPNVNWGVSPSHLFLAEDVLTHAVQPVEGQYVISTLPGLGIEVNEQIIEKYLIK